MVDKMRYTTQAIVVLAKDLNRAAVAIHVKRKLADDIDYTTRDGQDIKRSMIISGEPHSIDQIYCRPNSRLIIIAHGAETSRNLLGDQIRWSPTVLAQKVGAWLGANKIAHISLKMCYSGGNRAGAAANKPEAWATSATESFAGEFAQRCGFADSIGAYTDVHTTAVQTTEDGKLSIEEDSAPYSLIGEGTLAQRRYKVLGDKVIFYPDPSARHDNIVPTRQPLSMPSSNKAKPWVI
jgi:Peptidase C80 family